MKSYAVAAFLFSSLVSFSAEACNPSFSLINDTRFDVVGVYTRLSGQTGWSVEQLGEDTVLNAGQKYNFNFSATYSTTFDMKIVFADKVAPEWRNVPLCSITQASLTYNSVTKSHNLNWQ